MAAIVTIGCAVLPQPEAQAQQSGADEKPNILVTFGDDIGQSDISLHLWPDRLQDRIANEGMMFTDGAEPHCGPVNPHHRRGNFAHRAKQSRRAGCDGRPAKGEHHSSRSAQTARLATGQFGQNGLGDRDEFPPTAHGFDGFFGGNLYRLNAEDEPE
jgi:arylsulfatase A-like enzyme